MTHTIRKNKQSFDNIEPTITNGRNQIVIYQTEYGQTQINVRLEEDIVWLSTNQMALLFNREDLNIRRHISMFLRKENFQRIITCIFYTFME